jgi:hypothetical protein
MIGVGTHIKMNTDELIEIQKELKSPIGKPAEYVVTKILQKKGQLCRIKYARPLRIRKEFQSEYSGMKITDGVFRVGISYDNTKAVQEKRLSGELPAENQGLRNRVWLVPNYLMKGKDDKLLVRIYTVRNAYRRIYYELNSEMIDFETLQGMNVCLASEFVIKPDLVSFDLEVDHILEMT